MTDSLTFIGRSLRHSVRSIDALLTAILLPVAILLMFVYVFGGAIETGGRYVDYVVPGIIVLCAGFGSAGTAVAVALDMTTGVIDRFRTLPISAAPCSPATSPRASLRNVVSTALVIGVALIAGFRPVADAARLARRRRPAARADDRDLVAGRRFGLLATSVEAANALTFVAAFAPYLSQRVRPAEHDARRPAVDRRAPARHADRRHAARAACSALPVGNEALVALAWCAGAIVVGAVAAAALFRSRSEGRP